MTERKTVRPAILPFLIGDLLLLALAGKLVLESPTPLSLGQTALCTMAVALGAWLLATPFILQYRADLKLAEADALSSTVAQIQNLEQIKIQITEATGLWQDVQGECARTANLAKEVADGMAAEAKAFVEAMQKANDAEKATLRLEVEKLRRTEGDWLQVLVRVLDHVYALYLAGVQSGQPQIIQQLAYFQNACRDSARRVGLAPFVPELGELFNPQAHQPADAQATVSASARIARVLATGYTYQGRLIRPALVDFAVGEPAGGIAQDQPAVEVKAPSPQPEARCAAEPAADATPVPGAPAQTNLPI